MTCRESVCVCVCVLALSHVLVQPLMYTLVLMGEMIATAETIYSYSSRCDSITALYNPILILYLY